MPGELFQGQQGALLHNARGQVWGAEFGQVQGHGNQPTVPRCKSRRSEQVSHATHPFHFDKT